jgi:hypothetical protein
MEHVAFERWARPLLLLHAGFAIALAGASTHLFLTCLKMVQKRPYKARLVRIYGQTVGVLFATVFGWGLLCYPSYRYYVRGLYFDRYAPWASNLFDMKENLAALALPLSFLLFAVTRRFDPRHGEGPVPVLFVLALLVFVVVVFCIGSGLLVTCVKGV